MDDQLSRAVADIEQVIAQGSFQDNWASLSQYHVPDWYRDAKFGIFIHWGVFCVPAFNNEWYSRNMYIQGSPEFEHHRETYGAQEQFGYKEFIPLFHAKQFDAEAWAELFAEAGARYVVPVAEHHDGFMMYKSKLSHWNAYEMGPKRDVLAELSRACKARGLVTGASSHRAEHWFFMSHGKEFDSDIKEPLQRGDFYWPSMPEGDLQDLFSVPMPTQEYLDDWLVRTCELIDSYRPRMLYFDWWIQHSSFKPYLQKLAAYYYNRAAQWGEEVVIHYKHDAFAFGTAVVDVERGQFADAKPYCWQTDTSTAYNSWCYTEQNQYKSAPELLCDLVDIVSKNGCLLLNIGPKADGTIPEQERALLQTIGAWLKINGEAIYGSRVWRKYGEGPTQVIEGQFSDGVRKAFTAQDVRYTANKGAIYAIALAGSPDGHYVFPALGEQDASKKPNFHGLIDKVTYLAKPEAALTVVRTEAGLAIDAPVPTDELPVVFRIQVR